MRFHNRYRKILALTTALITVFSVPAFSAVESQLTADEMNYDTKSQVFNARGHVKLTRLKVTITSDFGSADNIKKRARMWSKVVGSGSHDNIPLHFVCKDLTVIMSEPETRYVMSGAVDGTYGPRSLQANQAWYQGQDFGASQMKRFYDAAQRTTFVADRAWGSSDKNGLMKMSGVGDVYYKQDAEKGGYTEMWGSEAYYDRIAGTTLVSGPLHARQVSATNEVSELWGKKGIHNQKEGTVTVAGPMRGIQRAGNGNVTELWGDNGVYSTKEEIVTITGSAHGIQNSKNGDVSELWGNKSVYSQKEQVLTVTGSLHGMQHAKSGEVTELWGNDGVYSQKEGLTTITGAGHIKHKTTAGELTEIWGDKLIRSEKQGTVIATGHASAVQTGRRITADELIYYPSTGKLKANGHPHVTVDISRVDLSPKKTHNGQSKTTMRKDVTPKAKTTKGRKK